MGYFAENKMKMNEASPTAGGLYFQPGNYVVRVDRVHIRSGFKGDSFIIETTVVESDNEVLPEGSKPSQVLPLPGKFPDSTKSNMKNFLLAAYSSLFKENGMEAPTEDQIGDKEADEAIGVENPLAGTLVKVNAFRKEGSDYTHVRWA